MGQTADELRQEIDQKRDDASRKIDQIESRIESTTEHVRDEVQHTAEQVTSQVKESLDIKRHIEERPLVALGVGLVGGFLLGGVSGGDGGRAHHGGQGGHSMRSELMGSLRKTSKETGLDDTLAAAASALMASLTDQAKGIANEKVAEIKGDKPKQDQRTVVTSERVATPVYEEHVRVADTGHGAP